MGYHNSTATIPTKGHGCWLICLPSLFRHNVLWFPREWQNTAAVAFSLVLTKKKKNGSKIRGFSSVVSFTTLTLLDEESFDTMWASKRFLSVARWPCALAKDFGVVIDQCQKSETSHCAYFLAQWIIDTLILQIKWHLDLHHESLKFFEPSFWLVLVMSEFWLQVSRTRPQIPHAHTRTHSRILLHVQPLHL